MDIAQARTADSLMADRTVTLTFDELHWLFVLLNGIAEMAKADAESDIDAMIGRVLLALKAAM
jgi:hypothetical protein